MLDYMISCHLTLSDVVLDCLVLCCVVLHYTVLDIELFHVYYI